MSARAWDQLWTWGMRLGGWLSGGALLWLVGTVFWQAMPAIKRYGWTFLTSQVWILDTEEFGGLAFIFGSLVSSACALALALPLGIGIGILTSRQLPLIPPILRTIAQSLMVVMTTIPSVIIGLWGLTLLVPIFGASMFCAILVLTLMITPTIAEVCRSAYDEFPILLRNSSIALGLTFWETLWQLYIPANLSATLSAGVLALGRALGETMAVTMVIGNPTRPSVNWSLFAPAATIPSLLANQFGEAFMPIHISALMYLALVLFLMTTIANLLALLIRSRLVWRG